MIVRPAVLLGAGAIAALVVAGCSSDAGEEHPAGHGTSPSVTETTASSGEAHNAADVTFAQQMIPHHTQAIEMSDILLAKQGIDPRVTDLANQIKAAQGPEIQQMQGWLDRWGDPRSTEGTEHGDHGGMSGMMSDQDMNALRGSQGVDGARMFLTQMIAHHEGAIAMAQTEIDGGQDAAAVELARSIVATQQQEIDTMKDILGEL
jgi:uncharacterized protein (DUF305 family)